LKVKVKYSGKVVRNISAISPTTNVKVTEHISMPMEGNGQVNGRMICRTVLAAMCCQVAKQLKVYGHRESRPIKCGRWEPAGYETSIVMPYVLVTGYI
jgi:hypothetical protein